MWRCHTLKMPYSLPDPYQIERQTTHINNRAPPGSPSDRQMNNSYPPRPPSDRQLISVIGPLLDPLRQRDEQLMTGIRKSRRGSEGDLGCRRGFCIWDEVRGSGWGLEVQGSGRELGVWDGVRGSGGV